MYLGRIVEIGTPAADLRGPAARLHAVAPQGRAGRRPATAQDGEGPELQADPLADLPGRLRGGAVRYDEVAPGHLVLKGDWGGFARDEVPEAVLSEMRAEAQIGERPPV